jgi:hypothetical protein
MQRSQLSLKGRASCLDFRDAAPRENFLSWLAGQLLQLGAADQATALTPSAERQKPGEPNNLNRT